MAPAPRHTPPGPEPFPYRLALAGGWIDQPFVSSHDPDPPGSMVVVQVWPDPRFVERSGLATSTRRVALELWPGGAPAHPRDELVRALYAAENAGRAKPSGSQDMVGLLQPGISRLDYDVRHEGGVFPVRVESTSDPEVVGWLERVLKIVPLEPRPAGYDPLDRRRLDPGWVRRLGRSGSACYDAILARDLAGLAASLDECMACWRALLPSSFEHPALSTDLLGVLANARARYPGAMISASGGGYLYVVSDEPVDGGFHPRIRTADDGV